MSVMMLNEESFKKNYEGVCKFGKKYMYSNVYSWDIEPLFEELQKLNALSYNERYKEEAAYIPFKETIINDSHNIYSLLKSLECLKYNIELPYNYKLNPKEETAMEFLKHHIESLKNYIINEILEYKTATWN